MKIKTQREQAAAEAADAAKQEELRVQYAEKKKKAFKTKEQRNLDANNRQRIRDIEKQMNELQDEQDRLEAELTDEKVISDYSLMNEKCTRINEIKELSNQLFDEWAELSESL